MGDVELYDAGGAAANAAGDSAHLADTVDAHDATAISYAGANGISATDVEGAIDELDLEKQGRAHVWKPTAALFETFTRHGASLSATIALLSSGRLSMAGIWLPTGLTVTSISFFSGTTAFTPGTDPGTPHQVFGLFDNSRALLRSTADDGNTAWAASSKKTLALTSSFVTTYTGLYYLGILVTTGTGGSPAVPTIFGASSASGVDSPLGQAPITSGSSTTGLTDTLPNPAAAITPTSLAYAYVS